MPPHPSTCPRFARLQWFFPAAITLHNLEEAIWLPEFVAAHRARLPWTVNAGMFRSALVVLTAAAWAVTYFSWRKGPRSAGAYLLFGSIIAMLVNVLVPHVPAAIVFHGYAPGVVTAVLVNLPVLALLTSSAIKEGYVCGSRAVVFGIAVPLGITVLYLLLFAFGWSFLIGSSHGSLEPVA